VPVIGITGGIATGKSALSGELRRVLPTAEFFDADESARSLTDSDAEVRALIEEAFGPRFILRRGT
jgi:dephospho-CoA kinase